VDSLDGLVELPEEVEESGEKSIKEGDKEKERELGTWWEGKVGSEKVAITWK